MSLLHEELSCSSFCPIYLIYHLKYGDGEHRHSSSVLAALQCNIALILNKSFIYESRYRSYYSEYRKITYPDVTKRIEKYCLQF